MHCFQAYSAFLNSAVDVGADVSLSSMLNEAGTLLNINSTYLFHERVVSM